MVRVTAAPPPPPPEERANLEGRVTAFLGTIPIKGAKVIIDNGEYRETFTDENGRYVFTGIELANWTVRVKSPTITYADAVRTINITEPRTYVLNIELPLSLTAKAILLGSLSALIGGALALSRRR